MEENRKDRLNLFSGLTNQLNNLDEPNIFLLEAERLTKQGLNVSSIKKAIVVNAHNIRLGYTVIMKYGSL